MKQWPEKPEWDDMAEAMKTLAKVCGAKVHCSQKYEYLKVEFQQSASTSAQMRALYLVAELIEQASESARECPLGRLCTNAK